jgi:hypothetical protein
MVYLYYFLTSRIVTSFLEKPTALKFKNLNFITIFVFEIPGSRSAYQIEFGSNPNRIHNPAIEKVKVMITYSSSVLPLVQLLCESIRNTFKPITENN